MSVKSSLLLLVVLLGCGSKEPQNSAPKLFVKEVIDLLQKNAVNKHQINWQLFSDSVFNRAKHAQTISETYPAISYAISLLNDNHSYFRAVNDTFQTADNKPLPTLADEVTPTDIGYIRVPFCVGNQQATSAYIKSIQTKIKQQNKHSLKGWIIDLRGNFGGNMWPMLLAIEPLLGNGKMGYFIDADEQRETWTLHKGKAFINDTLIETNSEYMFLDLSKMPVALLTNNETASSGEALTIAFKGRANTKSFGQPTFGVSTGCVSHQLSDGSAINLAQSIFADRTLKKYGKKVLPDVITPDETTLEIAINWLYSCSEK